MKFILLVEGATERDAAAAFLKRWLDPRLREPVGFHSIPFDGYADMVRKMATKARMHLEGPRRSAIIAVIGLLDLYGPTFFPLERTTADDRVSWAREHFQREVDHDRFRFFFAVHEFEAWLLSEPKIFPREIANAVRKLAHPEQVNSSEPPAKLLNRMYQQHKKQGYKKTTYGKQLFAKLDPETAVAKCPYLKSMLDEMLALAKAAGL